MRRFIFSDLVHGMGRSDTSRISEGALPAAADAHQLTFCTYSIQNRGGGAIQRRPFHHVLNITICTTMPPKPIFYDASSPNEQAPSLPSAPLAKLSDTCVLQPPLSRRGTGPGLLIILPSHTAPSKGKKPLDPEPVQKWAEEGFAVVGITPSETLADDVLRAIGALQALSTLDTKDKFGIILHDTAIPVFPEQIACLVSYSPHAEVSHSIPIYVHTPSTENSPSNATVSVYPDVKSAHFVLPNSADYDAPSANLAHTRTLVFLRNHLGGPHFDIEAIWEEHTYWEFERRSVAQTMATMVVCPPQNTRHHILTV